MTFLCIVFLPPVYFLSRKKWGGFCLNAFLYGMALPCIISIVGIMGAPVFWVLAVGHAGFNYRREQTEHHANLVASKMAEKMQQPK